MVRAPALSPMWSGFDSLRWRCHCELSLLFLYSGFSLGTPVFPYPLKPTYDFICVDLCPKLVPRRHFFSIYASMGK